MRGDDLVEMVHVEIGDGRQAAGVAGIVEQTIETTELGERLLHQGSHVVFPGDVSAHEERCRPERLRQAFTLRLPSARDHHPRC